MLAAVPSARLLPGIVVLNYNYFPENSDSPAKVGATAFALSAVKVLEEFGLFRGIILYKRQEGGERPNVSFCVRNSIICATISFNFEMKTGLLRNAIRTTSEMLSCNDAFLPMLYYQTDTLLQYHPDNLPLCVTHHGPFYQDFRRQFSSEAASSAFGSEQKAQHLDVQQQLGIQYLKSKDSFFVFQHSQIQGDYLINSGVPAERIFPLCPPIHSMSLTGQPTTVPKPLKEALSSSRTLLFTAVARLDYFKNVDLLVDSAIQLLRQKHPLTVLIAGDDETDDSRRAKLFERIPISYRRFFYVVPKLQKTTLYWFFENARNNGLFVCPSRYETLGITPLEAGLCGVTTLIAKSELVEAQRFFPGQYCFVPTVAQLVTAIKSFPKAHLCESGNGLRDHLEKNISEHNFKKDFLHAWQACSQQVERVSAHEKNFFQ